MPQPAYALPDLDPPPPPVATVPLFKEDQDEHAVTMLAVPEPNAGLRQRGEDVADQALGIATIPDDATERRVGELLDVITELDTAIEADHRPGIDAAHKLHKQLCERMNTWRSKTQAALKHLRPMLARRLQDKQRAEEARQREERERAQQAERERLLAEAVHAEQTGESTAVVQQMMLEAEHVAPPPVAARPITDVRNVSTRANWKAEVTDLHALVVFVAANPNWLSLLEPNMPKLNQQATSLNVRLSATIPGVRAVNEPVLTKRRG